MIDAIEGSLQTNQNSMEWERDFEHCSVVLAVASMLHGTGRSMLKVNHWIKWVILQPYRVSLLDHCQWCIQDWSRNIQLICHVFFHDPLYMRILYMLINCQYTIHFWGFYTCQYTIHFWSNWRWIWLRCHSIEVVRGGWQCDEVVPFSNLHENGRDDSML